MSRLGEETLINFRLSKCLILGKIVNDQKATVEFFHGLPFPESAAKGFFQRKVAMYDDLDMMWNS